MVVFHVVISLVAIAAGTAVVAGFFGARTVPLWTFVFLAMTALTDVTGFLLPSEKMLPSHIVGIVSLVVLLATVLARYFFLMWGKWRGIYAVGAVISLYLNVFVLVVQGFFKVAFLRDLAPHQNEPPFMIAQLAVLAVFAALGYFSVRRFLRL